MSPALYPGPRGTFTGDFAQKRKASRGAKQSLDELLPQHGRSWATQPITASRRTAALRSEICSCMSVDGRRCPPKINSSRSSSSSSSRANVQRAHALDRRRSLKGGPSSGRSPLQPPTLRLEFARRSENCKFNEDEEFESLLRRTKAQRRVSIAPQSQAASCGRMGLSSECSNTRKARKRRSGLELGGQEELGARTGQSEAKLQPEPVGLTPPVDGRHLRLISERLLAHLKQSGFFDEVRMRLLAQIERGHEFERIRQRSAKEIDHFCWREVDLGQSRTKLRQLLSELPLRSTKSLLGSHIRQILAASRPELEALHAHEVRQLVGPKEETERAAAAASQQKRQTVSTSELIESMVSPTDTSLPTRRVRATCYETRPTGASHRQPQLCCSESS